MLELGVKMLRNEMSTIAAIAVSLTDQTGSSSAATAEPVEWKYKRDRYSPNTRAIMALLPGFKACFLHQDGKLIDHSNSQILQSKQKGKILEDCMPNLGMLEHLHLVGWHNRARHKSSRPSMQAHSLKPI